MTDRQAGPPVRRHLGTYYLLDCFLDRKSLFGKRLTLMTQDGCRINFPRARSL
jgi:hypothetical protein